MTGSAGAENDKPLIYVDSSVIIGAATGDRDAQPHCLRALSADARFVTTALAEIESLPQPWRSVRRAELSGGTPPVKDQKEANYIKRFCARYNANIDMSPTFLESALMIVTDFAVDPYDGLHVAAAFWLGASELITTELPASKIHRANKRVPIRCVLSTEAIIKLMADRQSPEGELRRTNRRIEGLTRRREELLALISGAADRAKG
jgi:predicted nucleic acid-binding protein